MSEWLRSIPAAQSEASAVYALSPDNLAQLALNDGLRATKLKPQRLRCYRLQVTYLSGISSLAEAVANCLSMCLKTNKQCQNASR